MSKLLPCPFCGSDARLIWPKDRDNGYAACLNIDCGSRSGNGWTFASIERLWNRRVPLHPESRTDGWIVARIAARLVALSTVSEESEIEALKHDLERVMQRENSLLSEVDRLREALEPFADFGDDEPHYSGIGVVACRHGAKTIYLEWADFRRARAALSQSNSDKQNG